MVRKVTEVGKQKSLLFILNQFSGMENNQELVAARVGQTDQIRRQKVNQRIHSRKPIVRAHGWHCKSSFTPSSPLSLKHPLNDLNLK